MPMRSPRTRVQKSKRAKLRAKNRTKRRVQLFNRAAFKEEKKDSPILLVGDDNTNIMHLKSDESRVLRFFSDEMRGKSTVFDCR